MNVLIVGCGLTGAVIARECADAGMPVRIIERRNHIAGNMYDCKEEHGFLVQKYGPHTFHTNDEELFQYICRFGAWDDFLLTCGAVLEGQYSPTPFNFRTIDTFYPVEYANRLKQKLRDAFPDRETATVVEVLDNEDADINAYARFLFEKDYRPYAAKQWGLDPKQVDASILKRVPLRFSYKEGYFEDRFQVMPKVSYTSFFQQLLAHPLIDVVLNTDALQSLFVNPESSTLQWNGIELKNPVVFTGPIDELFHSKFGALPYRSLHFEWKYESIESKQDAPVVAYPQELNLTRITEYKKLPIQHLTGTVYAEEYSLPYREGEIMEPYYPVLTQKSAQIYKQYAAIAEQIPNLYCCGRLGDFRYYNMDQALRRALDVAHNILSQ